MPKFDYIIMNPPYRGSVHLDFLRKAYSILDNGTGEMAVIEPATFLVNVRRNGKASEYDEIKRMLNGRVKKVLLDNMNRVFNIALYVPFAITYVDNSKIHDMIEYQRFDEKLLVESLYDCNLVGKYEIIQGILKKVQQVDSAASRIYQSDTEYPNDICYLPFCDICAVSPMVYYSIRPNAADTDERYGKSANGEFYKLFFCTLAHSAYDISHVVPKRLARGGSTANVKKYSNKDAICITGTKNELENWRYFVYNNKLPLFLNILLTIDQHNNSINYVPFIADKRYTDDEINCMFGFTNEEILLMGQTIQKFERHSLQFKRYMIGFNREILEDKQLR